MHEYLSKNITLDYLYIQTDNNLLNGEVPSEIGDLRKLTHLTFCKYLDCMKYVV